MSDLKIEFDAPDRIWSTNERLHWSKSAALTKEWRKATFVYATQAKRALFGDELGPALVQVTLPVRNKHRRDPHNYVGTVVKAIVDGLVDAELWPDDTAEWVTVNQPVMEHGADKVVVDLFRRA